MMENIFRICKPNIIIRLDPLLAWLVVFSEHGADNDYKVKMFIALFF